MPPTLLPVLLEEREVEGGTANKWHMVWRVSVGAPSLNNDSILCRISARYARNFKLLSSKGTNIFLFATYDALFAVTSFRK